MPREKPGTLLFGVRLEHSETDRREIDKAVEEFCARIERCGYKVDRAGPAEGESETYALEWSPPSVEDDDEAEEETITITPEDVGSAEDLLELPPQT